MGQGPDARVLEQAILNHIASMPMAERTGEGRLYVKVDLAHAQAHAEKHTGGLFLSMPHFGGDRDWLSKLMAFVRDGFARDEINVPYRVTVEDEEEFSSFRDEQAGTVLLNLLAYLRIRPR